MNIPKNEKQIVLSLASIYAFRMLGLFIILPIFSLYAKHFHHATPILIGLALGIYGLTQAILQIPLAMLSDRVGRKPIIIIGLLIFILGSCLAALSTSIYGIILGRALQGGGAIGSVLMALLADLTRVENRTKAMATIGMTIALSFAAAMVLGPALNSAIHLSGVFWLTAVLGCISLIIVVTAVPKPPRVVFHRDTEAVPALLYSVLTNPNLLRLNFSILIQHAILTATFIALPIVLAQNVGLLEKHQWYLYLPVLLLAFITMVPAIIIAEKKRKMKMVLVSAVFFLGLTQILLWRFHASLFFIAILLFIFFTAFTVLEAILPSMISKIAPAGSKGTAIGVYSTAQFLGIFLGGIIGGFIFSHFGVTALFLFCAILALIWLMNAATMQNPPHLSTLLLNVGMMSEEKARILSKQLQTVRGVVEAMIVVDEGVAHLKVDHDQLDRSALAQIAPTH